jgi:hypothetical protein
LNRLLAGGGAAAVDGAAVLPSMRVTADALPIWAVAGTACAGTGRGRAARRMPQKTALPAANAHNRKAATLAIIGRL